MMSMEYDFEKILAEYRSKKTPDGRRDCISRWAALTGHMKSEIAAALLAAGCQVDGRLVKGLKRDVKTVTPPDPTVFPGWEPIAEVREEPEPPEQEAPVPEPEPTKAEPTRAEPTRAEPDPVPEPPGMTVATLREMLAGVAGEGLILVWEDMAPVRRAELTAALDAQGERIYCHLALLGF